MKSERVFGSLLFLILFLALAPDAMARTKWYVDGVNGNDTNNCKTHQTACKTIGHAISLASSGDSIMIAPATYTENLTISISLKVIGAGAATTIIDGGATNTVITVNSGQVTLSALTIQNGYANAGGGIYNQATLIIKHSTITENHTKYTISGNHGGGGIYNLGSVAIDHSTISQNGASIGFFHTPGGGGIYNLGSGTISNSTVSSNASPIAGGIYNRADLMITGSTISGNSAASGYNTGYDSEGGGIYNSGTLTLTNSTLSGNRATESGDYNCGRASGGGILAGGTLTLNNSTLNGNYALNCGYSGNGGGIWTYNSKVILQNSIVANSPYGGNCSGTMTSNGYNLSSDNTCNFNNTGDMNDTYPFLGTLGDYGGPTQTIPLLSGSPAIDAGNPRGCTDGNGKLLKTDQRGKPRPDHEDTSGCDMGAYERQKD
jgi:hypothetical protein